MPNGNNEFTVNHSYDYTLGDVNQVLVHEVKRVLVESEKTKLLEKLGEGDETPLRERKNVMVGRHENFVIDSEIQQDALTSFGKTLDDFDKQSTYDLEAENSLIMGFNINNHFITCVFSKKLGEDGVMDISLTFADSKEGNTNLPYMEEIRNFLRKRYNEPTLEVRKLDRPIVQKENSHDCGPAHVENSLKIIFGDEYDSSDDFEEIRKRHIKILGDKFGKTQQDYDPDTDFQNISENVSTKVSKTVGWLNGEIRLERQKLYRLFFEAFDDQKEAENKYLEFMGRWKARPQRGEIILQAQYGIDIVDQENPDQKLVNLDKLFLIFSKEKETKFKQVQQEVAAFFKSIHENNSEEYHKKFIADLKKTALYYVAFGKNDLSSVLAKYNIQDAKVKYLYEYYQHKYKAKIATDPNNTQGKLYVGIGARGEAVQNWVIDGTKVSGFMIGEIYKHSPAYKNGLQKGDIITAIEYKDGRRVDISSLSEEQMKELIRGADNPNVEYKFYITRSVAYDYGGKSFIIPQSGYMKPSVIDPEKKTEKDPVKDLRTKKAMDRLLADKEIISAAGKTDKELENSLRKLNESKTAYGTFDLSGLSIDEREKLKEAKKAVKMYVDGEKPKEKKGEGFKEKAWQMIQDLMPAFTQEAKNKNKGGKISALFKSNKEAKNEQGRGGR